MALPSGYKQLEYIESSGTQFIDTGFQPNHHTRTVVVASSRNGSSGSYPYLFGCDVSYGNNSYMVSTWTAAFGSNATTSAFNWADGQIHTIDFDCGEVYIDESLKWSAYATVQTTYSMNLMGLNRAGTYYYFAGKIYSAKIYDNGNLIRDYVPALRSSDNVAGLYDLANDVFYTNAGTGTFSYAYPPIGPSRMLLMDGAGYDVIGGKALVDGTAYDILEGKVLIDGTSYTIPFKKGTPISELGVGTSVFLNVNGVPKEFLIVHKGNPSTSWYDGCDGTWLLMKDIYINQGWADTSQVGQIYNYQYNLSKAHIYLNDTFLNLLDETVRNSIMQVKIPYGMEYIGYKGTNGLPTKVFLLSAFEVGWTKSTNSNLQQEGVCLDYFSNCINADRIANHNGTAFQWWTRSPYISDTYSVCYVHTDGSCQSYNYSNGYGYRPAMILPNDILIDDGYCVIADPE